ncbi:hypothetical protein PAEAM_59750 [Paenibacillus sp. GM1FR]|nr:hypothetical protein PAEAM_59750 [Paenibacillus sp. GM1FR]
MLKKTSGFLFDFILCSILYFIGITLLWGIELQVYPMMSVNPKDYILIFFVINSLITFLIHSRFYNFGDWYTSRKLMIKSRTNKKVMSVIIIMALIPVVLTSM